MQRSQVEQLGLPLMSENNATRLETAFTVSIESREGVTTGISAHDRAKTISVAIDPKRVEMISFHQGTSFLSSREMEVP